MYSNTPLQVTKAKIEKLKLSISQRRNTLTHETMFVDADGGWVQDDVVIALANAAAENAAECERLRGLVRELRAGGWRHLPFPQINRLNGEEHQDFVARVEKASAKQRADYDAATNAMLTPLSSLETAKQAGEQNL